MLKNLIVVFAIIGLVGCQTTRKPNTSYDITFGILKEAVNIWEVETETTRIPLIPSKSFRFGININPNGAAKFDVRIALFAPDTVMAEEKATQVSENIVTANGSCEKLCSMDMWSSKDDPLGHWTLEVYIDGILSKTIEYDLVKL